MHEGQRILSELKEFKGELKEFKRATLSRLDTIEREVKGNSQFKWKILGGFGLVFFIFEFLKH